MKWKLLSVICFILAGCLTTSGTYTVKAFDSSGNELTKISTIAEGSRIYTVISGLCRAYPGSTVIITDIKTQQELKSESPHQCRGEPVVQTHRFVAPKELSSFDAKYKMVFENSQRMAAIYEYTSNDEAIEDWTTLRTIIYEKGVTSSPQEWLSQQNEQIMKPIKSYVSAENAYVQLLFKPEMNTPYYETAIKKSFFIKDCEGLITYIYSKKYSKSEQPENIALDSQELATAIEKDHWMPNCPSGAN